MGVRSRLRLSRKPRDESVVKETLRGRLIGPEFVHGKVLRDCRVRDEVVPRHNNNG